MLGYRVPGSCISLCGDVHNAVSVFVESTAGASLVIRLMSARDMGAFVGMSVTHTCMYTHTHKHTHTHTHTHTHVHVHTYTHTYMYTHTHKHTHTYMYTHTHTRTCTHTYTQTNTHTHVHVHVHTDIHPQTYTSTHTHTHTHTEVSLSQPGLSWSWFVRCVLCVTQARAVCVMGQLLAGVFVCQCVYSCDAAASCENEVVLLFLKL